MSYAKINPRNLDTACIIEEEPNSAQRRVPPYRNRTWSLSHLLAAAWGNEQMHLHQKCAHFLWSYPADDLSSRTDFVRSPDLSPFEDVFWDQKGEGGVPPGGWCQNYAITELNVKNSDQTNSRFRKLSRSSPVR